MTKVEREIYDQIEELPKVLEFSRSFAMNDLENILRSSDIVYFVGCGSSYYLALAASRYFTLRTGIESKALPGGEVAFESPENIGQRDMRRAAVLISRSGESSEVLRAGERFQERGIRTVGITLESSSSLVKMCDESVVVPLSEESIVMTKSFTSMLLTLEIMVDRLVSRSLGVYEKLLDGLESTVGTFREWVKRWNMELSDLYVFLGTGVYEGIARESALKLEEMSLSKVEAYSTYEYRHGPKALMEKGVAAVVYTSGSEEERRLCEELETFGAKVLTIGCEGSHIFVGNNVPQDAFLRVIFGQILALDTALRKGVDVERPRNLTKVVKLAD